MKSLLCLIAVTHMAFLNTASADAHLCDEDAPRLDSGYYFEIADHSPLPIDQLQSLRAFANKVEGTWQGKEAVIRCQGHFSQPEVVSYQYRLDADISSSVSGVLRLTMDKLRGFGHESHLETVWLSPATNPEFLRQHWHTLEFTDADTVVYSEKYRARNGNGFSRLIHEIKKLSFDGNVLTIDRKRYVNGTITEQSGISLIKTTI